jgi:hypothetical protein
VFDKNYKLMPLDQLEKYISDNRHLPEIPSAEAMEKDGMGLGDLQTKLLAKIEELTLHLIEQNNRLEKQNQEIANLKEMIGK